MKMNRISIPSSITFTQNENTRQHKNKHLTYGRLKILHTGETADGRQFAFSSLEELIGNLPHTPITGNYIEEKGDFGGHDEIKQVYGFIPEVGEYGLETIDGQEWIVADVGLFTGVRGGVGDIAAQVFGKSHSLELDPATAEVEFIKKGNRQIMNIIKGTITELCILGDDYRPAFTGSEFFSTQSPEEQLNILIAQFQTLEKELNLETNSTVFAENSEVNGGVKMDKFLEFMRETYGERMEKVYAALQGTNGDSFYIAQFGEDTVVYCDFENDFKYYKIKYSENEEGQIVFEEPIEVVERFLTQDEIDTLFTVKESDEVVVDEAEGEADAEEQPEEEVTEINEEIVEDEVSEEVIVEVAAPSFEEQLIEQVGFNLDQIREILAANTQDNAEFVRLQNLEKETLLQTFAEVLDENELASIRDRFTDLTLEDIEKEASFIGFKKIKNNKDNLGFNRLRPTVEGEQPAETNTVNDLINQFK